MEETEDIFTFFTPFLKSTFNFEHFKKKEPHNLCIFEVGNREHKATNYKAIIEETKVVFSIFYCIFEIYI